jgi:hypothetical protein
MQGSKTILEAEGLRIPARVGRFKIHVDNQVNVRTVILPVEKPKLAQWTFSDYLIQKALD